MGRDVWTQETTEDDRRQVLAALAAASRWIKIFYGWRPNLRDEGDDHLVELAIAGGAEAILTIRLPEGTTLRLKQPAASRGISLNKLMEGLGATALAVHDTETRFRPMATAGDRKAAFDILARLDEHDSQAMPS